MNLDQPFYALSDPARRNLIRTLSNGPKTAGDLAKPFDISRPAISRHLRVLRETGLVTAEMRGREHWYSLNLEPIDDMQQWLGEVASVWQQGLQELKAFVEESDEPGE